MTPPRSDPTSAGLPARASLAPRVEGELGQMREALANLIELSGMSRRQVERRLLEGDCGTDLGRLLSGRQDLKMKHLLTLCRVIDLDPVEFLQIALKPRPDQRSPLLRRLEALLPSARAATAAPALRAADEGQRFSIDAPAGSAGQTHRAAMKLAQEAGKAVAHCCLAFMEIGAAGWHRPAAAAAAGDQRAQGAHDAT